MSAPTPPTTAEVADNIIAQLEANLNQTIPAFAKSFFRVLAKTMAAVYVILYKYCGFIALQMFIATASNEPTTINGVTVIPLQLLGVQNGTGLPASATSAELLIDVTVENQTGSLASGSQLINSANGITYLTIGDVLLDAATVQATIRAASDQSGGDGSGSQGNLEPGSIVSFANPLPNVSRNAVVDSQTITGADGETTAAYRQRVLDTEQKRPQGGAYADYELWGEEPAGIINIYPYTGSPGEVDVYAEATVESSGDPDGIPTDAQLEEVAESINLDDNGLASRRSANALVNVYPISRIGFVVNVSGLVVDNLGSVQDSITDAVEEYFLDRGPFIDGLTILPRKDRISRSAVSGTVDDIVSASGGIFSGVTMTLNDNLLEFYSLGEGEKAKAESVTFV